MRLYLAHFLFSKRKEVINMFKIGNLSASELREKYGTPLYVYDEVQIKNNISEYVDNFKSDLYKTEIIYASKAFQVYICIN